jgi:hypothetical protein
MVVEMLHIEMVHIGSILFKPTGGMVVNSLNLMIQASSGNHLT